YNNVISLVGFGGFFAIWLQLGQDFSAPARGWSGGLILISLSSFVIWNIIQMLLNAFAVVQNCNTLTSQGDPQKFFEDVSRSNDIVRQRRSVFDKWLWVPTFFISLSTGLLAMILLGINAFSIAVGRTGWPI
ncbi:MAG: hypothetical protein ACK5SX_12305, partial [Sandaracinobacter sp.]